MTLTIRCLSLPMKRSRACHPHPHHVNGSPSKRPHRPHPNGTLLFLVALSQSLVSHSPRGKLSSRKSAPTMKSTSTSTSTSSDPSTPSHKSRRTPKSPTLPASLSPSQQSTPSKPSSLSSSSAPSSLPSPRPSRSGSKDTKVDGQSSTVQSRKRSLVNDSLDEGATLSPPKRRRTLLSHKPASTFHSSGTCFVSR